MAAIRRAEVSWKGDLQSGRGSLHAMSSDAFSDLPVTWASRAESSDGRTSPEELLASAHASCFAMAFSGELARAGTPPENLDVSCEVTFDRIDGKWTVASSTLTVRGRVPGIDSARFSELATVGQGQLPHLARAPGQRQVERQRAARIRGHRGLISAAGLLVSCAHEQAGFAQDRRLRRLGLRAELDLPAFGSAVVRDLPDRLRSAPGRGPVLHDCPGHHVGLLRGNRRGPDRRRNPGQELLRALRRRLHRGPCAGRVF